MKMGMLKPSSSLLSPRCESRTRRLSEGAAVPCYGEVTPFRTGVVVLFPGLSRFDVRDHPATKAHTRSTAYGEVGV